MRADDLLAGPRGRRLCLEVASQRIDDCSAMSFAHPGVDGTRRALLDMLAGFDPDGLTGDPTEPVAFADAMDMSVTMARYWQSPDDADLAADDPKVIAALRPVAEAIAAAPAARWWGSPVDLDALRYTSRYDEQHPASPPELSGAAAQLRAWRDRTDHDVLRGARSAPPPDPARGVSGTWWSTPSYPARLPNTTRSLPGLGAVSLVWEEDSFGQQDAVVWPLAVRRSPRVWEIDGPEAWSRLVAEYPLDVSDARRYDWYRATGRLGRWLLPDWPAVAADWDAVHVSVAAYLVTATRALPVPGHDDAATVLAGWDPDQTWWLTDVLEAAGPAEQWTSRDAPDGLELGWRRIDG